MPTLELFATLCRYNQWMNRKLYAVCAAMPDAMRKENKGAAFGSMHGTLNHLLLADRVWLGRFTGVPFMVGSLGQELYADFDELRQERELTDAALAAWLGTLSEGQLAEPFTYTSLMSPEPRTYPLWFVVGHIFNHQTHHRGQLTTLLEQCGYDSGVTDLLMLPPAPL